MMSRRSKAIFARLLMVQATRSEAIDAKTTSRVSISWNVGVHVLTWRIDGILRRIHASIPSVKGVGVGRNGVWIS
jgi:hypothetical protein